MLVGTFKVHIRREGQFFTRFHHRLVRGARIKPHIQSIHSFFVVLCVVANQLNGIHTVPVLNTFFFHTLSDFFHDRDSIGVKFLCFFMRK